MAAPAATTGRLTTSPAWAPLGRPSAHTGLAALPASLARPASPRKAHLRPPHPTTALAQEDIPSFIPPVGTRGMSQLHPHRGMVVSTFSLRNGSL